MSERYEAIRYARAGDVALISLDRAESLNSLNGRMRRELTRAFTQAPQEGARAVLLTGEGRSFCSGQDLGEAQRQGMPDIGRTLREEYVPMLRAIADCPVPTIAAVNGVAAGAGAGLALMADLTVCGKGSQFVIAFARIGLIPDAGLTYLLPRLVGLQRAMGLTLTTEPLTGEKAEDWGLVWKAFEDEKLIEESLALAQRLAAGPTLSYKLAKQALRAGWEDSLTAQLTRESELQTEAGRSRDFAEGVMAFLEKRKPTYEGR
ncbi:enoyl-CoA hydratase-related protein [Neomegalonema perideroedes]|uniref:enoyl-CoA hydratase-related protein n=1 Tax=Neomegalonema perideroedes TaxID=217219 RepID=UPI00036B81BB|nr:enoyl-CoA hydratase-related protein [Neomegalonema perideroedes]